MRELMTREIAEGLPGLYEQDGAEDPTVYAHYFSCVNGWDWWLLEFDGTDEAFGLVEGYDDELGYFSLKEMAELNRSMGFAVVERDFDFDEVGIIGHFVHYRREIDEAHAVLRVVPHRPKFVEPEPRGVLGGF